MWRELYLLSCSCLFTMSPKVLNQNPMCGFWRSFSLNVEFMNNMSILFVPQTRQKLRLRYFNSVSAFLLLALGNFTQIRSSSAWTLPAWDPETSSRSGHIIRLCSSALRCANAALAVFDLNSYATWKNDIRIAIIYFVWSSPFKSTRSGHDVCFSARCSNQICRRFWRQSHVYSFLMSETTLWNKSDACSFSAAKLLLLQSPAVFC